MKTITLAFTGASGMPYGLRLLECLLQAGIEVELVYSQAAQVVAKQELNLAWPSMPDEVQSWLCSELGDFPGQLRVRSRSDWFAPIASGSSPSDAMVICPCSMTTLAKIAAGISDNLIVRAADVAIKEHRPLIIVPRETPLSPIHLENMLKLARMGAVILPPSPGFYHQPQTLLDMVDFVVARILDQLGIPQQLVARWGCS